jgi:tripartite-type tricarboxylate transporter receptor subunit TctC
MRKEAAGTALALMLFILLFSDVKLWAAPFYEGKTIRIVCGSLPGGGTDRYSRLLAKYLPKYIPGAPTIIVENVPGAGSLIAAGNLYNLEKPNGLVFGIFNQALPFAQLLKAPGVRFDLTKYEWIGSVSREAVLFTVRSDLPYTSVSDLRKLKEPMPLATSGPATMTHQFPTLLQEFAGMNFKMVTYPSGTEGLLAVERKEADGHASTLTALAPYIKRGLVRPLIRGRISAPGIENLPIDEDLSTDKRGKTLMALRTAADQIARPYVAPPKTPADRMKILRSAFAQALSDPGFLDETHKYGMLPDYVTAEESMKILGFIFNQPEDVVRDFGKFIKF